MTYTKHKTDCMSSEDSAVPMQPSNKHALLSPEDIRLIAESTSREGNRSRGALQSMLTASEQWEVNVKRKHSISATFSSSHQGQQGNM